MYTYIKLYIFTYLYTYVCIYVYTHTHYLCMRSLVLTLFMRVLPLINVLPKIHSDDSNLTVLLISVCVFVSLLIQLNPRAQMYLDHDGNRIVLLVSFQ